MTVRAQPSPGDVEYDAHGRTLIVRDVQPGDPLGREVVGHICRLGDVDRYPYACPLTTWADVWRDRLPTPDASRMKVG